VAFAPDGMTGYMAVLTDNGEVPVSAGRSYLPVLWKTTDAGLTWEGPITVALAGENGIDEVKNFLSDEELEELYGTIPDRDSIPFTTAFDFDLHVDALGNPHIAVVIGITGDDPYSFITGQSEISGYMFAAAFDITYDNANENWMGYELGRIKTFRGYFGDITEGNRIQIASSWDGAYMFVTWNDTDLPGVQNNQQPDIWCRGINVMLGYLTSINGLNEPYNVTEFSQGMWQAYFHNLSYYAFDVEGVYYLFTVPLTYLDMNPEDPGEEVLYKYITDFKADFFIDGISDLDGEKKEFDISGAVPNPASNKASFAIEVFEAANLELSIYNLTGQKVLVLPGKPYPPGTHPITFDVSGFNAGVYFLIVTSGDTQVARKMIVE
jgi:hypothetical protein